MCWYLVQWNRKCSAVSLSEPHSQIGLVDVPVLWPSSFSMESWRNDLTYEIPISGVQLTLQVYLQCSYLLIQYVQVSLRVWCWQINWITVDGVTPDSWCSVVVHLENAWWLIQLLLWNHIICKLYCIYLKTDDHLCIPGQAGWVLNSSSNTTSPGPVIIGLFVVHKRIYN